MPACVRVIGRADCACPLQTFSIEGHNQLPPGICARWTVQLAGIGKEYLFGCRCVFADDTSEPTVIAYDTDTDEGAAVLAHPPCSPPLGVVRIEVNAGRDQRQQPLPRGLPGGEF